MKIHKTILAFVGVCLFVFSGENKLVAQSISGNVSVLGAEKTDWHGFDRYDFIMDEETLVITPSKSLEGEGSGVKDPAKGQRRCILIVPKEAAPDKPWTWRGCYWDHQPQTEIELLKRGFHVAYISASHTIKPGKPWDAWYEFLTKKMGLSSKPAFIGMSRGGEYSYLWSTQNPDKVSCIYADNTGCDLEIMRGLVDLALYDVPVLQVCGSIDPILGKCALVIENNYRQFGGRISMMLKEGAAHHPHSLNDPKIIADFIEKSVREKKSAFPDFANEKTTRTSFYSTASTFVHFPKEGRYITCYGPLFTECYDRYDLSLAGVEGTTSVIAPKVAAPGKPWVFRSEFVKTDATVDLALLAKGYYIVTGAVSFNADGPILEQWDLIYKHLTEHGFSKKPVLEGRGSSTGEMYTWAIANPDKVSCIYGENPILQSNLAKVQPIDNLLPLAKAGVPLLHFCGSIDPVFGVQTKEVEKRYKKLGGRITVLVNEGEGHELTFSDKLNQIVEFILKEGKM